MPKRDREAVEEQPFSVAEQDGPSRRKSQLARPAALLPSNKVQPNASDQKEKDDEKVKTATFSDAKSRSGVELVRGVLVIAIVLCLLWTLWLILLNVAPNDTVNHVMRTEDFDDGSFWLIVESPKALVVLATCGLVAVAAIYVAILVSLLTTRLSTQRVYIRPNRINPMATKIGKAFDTVATTPSGRVTSRVAKLAASLVQSDSNARKHLKLWLEIGDLALEVVLLHQMLESGTPAVLIGIYTVIVASNALSCAVLTFIPYKQTVLIETLIDILFDLLVAIGYPLFVVLYCLSTFSMDRKRLAINLEIFAPGWFERAARVIADPVQTAIIGHSLHSLRITSALDFFTRVGVNLTLCARLHHAAKLVQDPRKQRGSLYPKHHYPAAVFFVIFTVVLIVFVEESMRTSSLACQPHPECVMNAHRWMSYESGSLTQCPCRILIDRDIAPKSYAEWLQPRDVTEKVAQLASMGELQAVLITNRYLPVLPEELRWCRGMRHLSLEYTHAQTMPAWVKEFAQLEFLHIESKTISPMGSLPEGMFDDMSSLTFIHFAAFIPVARLPSFDGLVNLRSLTLAVFLAIEELPSFDHLYSLERLVISCVPMLHTLPDFAALTNLKAFAALDRGEWCCNGFLGDCNLENPLCQPHLIWGSPAASCLPTNRTDAIASPSTLAAVEKFSSSTCGPVLRPSDLDGPPTEDRVSLCNGTMWKQCNKPGTPEAICYNERLMVVTCSTSRFTIKMRRTQIQEGAGDPCNPEVEAWLGCK